MEINNDLRTIKIKRPGKEEPIEAAIVPFSPEQEMFSMYMPVVPKGHPLDGRIIKVKNVVVKMLYLGPDAQGEPLVQLQSQQIVTVE